MSTGSIFRSIAVAALVLVIAAGSASAQFTGKYKRYKLLEQFTSATCPPCAAASPFMETVVKLENDIISLRYHMNYPAPGDPWNVLNGRDPSVRHDLYGISGIPYLRVGGTLNVNPTAGVAAINNLVSQIPPTSMAKIDVKQVGGKVEVTVTTDRALSGAKLFFATVQRTVTIANLPQTLSNSNGESKFGDIMMFMYPDANGTVINQGAGETKTYTFVPGFGSGREWNPANLYGIAFIQDDATLEIIQAGASVTSTTPAAFDYFEASSAKATISGFYERIDRGATAEKIVTITNTSSAPVTVDLSVSNSEALNQVGMSAELVPAKVTVAGNGTASATLKVTGANRSVFVNVNAAVAATDGLGGVVPPVYYLVNGAKVVNYYGVGGDAASVLTQLSAQASAKYGSDVVYMPYATEILTNYPMNTFSAAVFPFEGAWTNLRGATLSSIENMLRAKKGVWIQTQAAMYAAYDRYGPGKQSASAFDASRTFYANVVGVAFDKFEFRGNFDANGNLTSIITFPVKGTAGDPIGNGITFTGNQATQDYPYFALGTDVMKLTTNSKAKSVLFYDNLPGNIGMVRVEPTYGGKLVYGSVGPEMIATESVRNNLTERVFDWLLGAETQSAKIAASVSTLNFGTIAVDGTKELSVTLTNTGNAELEITGVNLAGADAIAFDVTDGRPVNGNPIKVAAGATHRVTVMFAPTESKNNFGATLDFVSNASESPTIQLRGASTTTSVETEVVSETGAIRLTLVGANPVTDASSVRIAGLGTMNVTVVDAAGRTVATIFNGAVNGQETFSIGAGLASGTYSIVASNGTDRAVLSVVVAR
jgi:hypothetical protein